MNPEESKIEVTDGISRRRALKRIGAGAAIAWSAPILTSIRTPAFAQRYDTCDTCDVNLPCNVCTGPCGPDPTPNCELDRSCNCWVKADRSGCFCAIITLCSNLSPCGPGDSCPSGQTCVENCCGKLCYSPCDRDYASVSRRRVSGADGIRR